MEFDQKNFETAVLACLPASTPPAALAPLVRHAARVVERNQVLNLTRIVDPQALAQGHIVDSLAALPVLDQHPWQSVLDAGTGAGWPGLALAIARPDLRVILLDARRKKTEFLQEVVDELQLGDRVTVAWGRLDQWLRKETADVIVARALGPVLRLLDWCPRRYRGPLLLWKGRGVEEELRDAARRLEQTHRQATLVLDYALEPEVERTRHLLLIERS